MRSVFLLIITIIVTYSFSYGQSKVRVGDRALKINMENPKGKVINLSSVKSKVILLDFWAGWCKPCIKTIKTTLKPLYDNYSRDQFEIIGISYDKNHEKWVKSINKFELPWVHVRDNAYNQRLLKSYGVDIIPSYVLLDEHYNIIAKDIKSDDLKKVIEGFINK